MVACARSFFRFLLLVISHFVQLSDLRFPSSRFGWLLARGRDFWLCLPPRLIDSLSIPFAISAGALANRVVVIVVASG